MKNILLIIILLCHSFLMAQNNETTKSSKERDDVAVTIGLLKGGGALFGVDVERRFYNFFSGQIGFGLVGFGGGVNLHFNESLNSSFLSFQFYNQGIGDNHVQSLIGPSFNLRAFNFLELSIGIGTRVIEGPALPFEFKNQNAMLIYSLGVFKIL